VVQEKKSIVEALDEIVGLTVFRGAKYSVETRKPLPAASVDYFDVELSNVTENGSMKRSNSSYIIVLYVKILKDEEEQEDHFDEWLGNVLDKLQEKFPRFAMVMQRIGDTNYGGGTAYSAALLVTIGEQTYILNS